MNDQSDTPRLWAAKGEWVECLNGHKICQISHDIFLGDARHERDFENWQQPEPERTQTVPGIRCKECRSVWIRQINGGYQFHFADGWR